MSPKQLSKNNQSGASGKTGIRWGRLGLIAFIFLVFIAFYAMPFLSLPSIVNWIFNIGKKPPTLEEIIESTKPAPERNYTFKDVPASVKSRVIDCKKLNPFGEKLKSKNPLCLNLYKTSIEEIDKKIQTGEYDRVVLYGQYLILDTPSYWERDIVPNVEDKYKDVVSREDFAKYVYNSARFNDQIAVPAMFKLFGLKDLSLMATVIDGKNIFPYPAIYSRVSSFQDRKILCGTENGGGEFPPLGCATQFWANVVDRNVISEPMSLPEQRIHRIGREDFLYYDLSWPKNCNTAGIFMHETAHNLFDLSLYTGNHAGAVGDLKYFDEHHVKYPFS